MAITLSLSLKRLIQTTKKGLLTRKPLFCALYLRIMDKFRAIEPDLDRALYPC